MNASYQPEGELVDEAKADDDLSPEEKEKDPLKTAAKMSSLRNKAFGSKKFKDAVYNSPTNPNGPNFDPNSLKTS